MANYTPMIQQYLQVKADYPDAFLFFRLGDFYEMFFEDAIKAAKELEITLTSRQGGVEEPIPMCGVPHHSATSYIETLISRGYKVAICEQVEDPATAKGVVRREVVQLITPGTVMEGKNLAEKENNYIGTISQFSTTYGFGYIDLSTGEQKATLFQHGFKDVLNEISALGIKEIVVSVDFAERHKPILLEHGIITVSIEECTELTTTVFADDSNQSVHLFDQTHNELASSSVQAMTNLLAGITTTDLRITQIRLLNYIFRTQKRSLDHLQLVMAYEVSQFLLIDYYSKRNLELTETIRSQGKKGSLLWLLDETQTAMGGRCLKQWLEKPLRDRSQLENRQHFVELLMSHFYERENIRELLNQVYDLERLVGRVAFGNCNARDLLQLKKSLQQVPQIKAQLAALPSILAKTKAEALDSCSELAGLLENAIVEAPPISVKDGGMIKAGYSEELDQYQTAKKNGKTWLTELETKEKEITGIRSLKIGYNRIFGYFIEITRANLHLLKDERYQRKQTLANAERYITPKLKEMETIILEAEEKSIELEYRLFVELREKVKQYIARLQNLAKQLSELDCLQCFAKVSEERRYVKPVFSEERVLQVENGRHPVVEKVLKTQEFVPNHCMMNDECKILLLTGPNMAGKSTYMRQLAHIIVLAQIGCFVPADRAVLPIYDRIFTRIGATDDLIAGQSTFMVEMLEAKNAITLATKHSLLLFDEIGRGTSTYDGMAIAQAIIEYIHQYIGAHTLFSTHYHELTELEKKLINLKNIHVRAIEKNGKVIFLHKVVDGAADRSYGIHVAELAELPIELISRANEILKELEFNSRELTKNRQKQLSLFDDKLFEENSEQAVIDEILALSVLAISPLEALSKLMEWQEKLR